MNFMQKLIRFFQGRYGADQMTFGICALCVILAIVNLFVGSIWVYILVNLLFLYAFFRTMSRNFAARRKENSAFLKVFGRFEPSVRLFIRRFREGKLYRFRKCRHCKKVLRLPKKRGTHEVRCPNCKNRFKVHIPL